MAKQIATPQEMVRWMGAMQAQDFAMAKWAVGLRLRGVNDAAVEKAYNEGQILRAHLLRPTWHFVDPGDIRWMLALTAPRVNAANAYYYRKFELDTKTFNRCNTIFIKALEGSRSLTRTTLADELAKAKINAEGIRLSCIMMRAELDGILCSGPRDGKQFTYAILEERVPPSKALSKDEALAALTTRYFACRGPATLQDFANWSGLAITHAQEGINMLKGIVVNDVIDGQAFWVAAASPQLSNSPINKFQSTFLMPDYDEYAVSNKDRSAVFGAKNDTGNIEIGNPLFGHALIVDGVAADTRQRTIKGSNTIVETKTANPLSKIKLQAVEKAVKRYLEFVGGEKVKS